MTTATLNEQELRVEEPAPVVRMVACGSVDDGKSTLIGRLLTETDSVPIDQLEYARTTRRGGSTIPVGEIDYSLLTDGLEAEREQGITIDVAYRHMDLPNGRRIIIADAPGHEQYTRNMAVAASTADIGVLLVDAARGLRPQTYRHLTVCALMGVTGVIVAVNKMDLIGYEHATFEELAGSIRAAAVRLGIEDVTVIPVSAVTGANVIESGDTMPWYTGETVLGALETWEPPAAAEDAPFRLPVQLISRAGGNFRGYSGTIASGSVRVGDRLELAESGQSASVERVLISGEDAVEAHMGDAVTVTLDHEIDVTRGDLLCGAGEDVAKTADKFTADLVWLGEKPLAQGRSYMLYVGPRAVPATITAVRYKLDVVEGHQHAARRLEMNDIGRVEFATDSPIALDPYEVCRDTGGFLLVDRVSADTVAAGLTRWALRRGDPNIHPHDYKVAEADRTALMGHPPRVVWMTGLSGSGKSTIADAAVARLHEEGVHTFVLDGDNVRHGLNRDLGFTPGGRAENVRRVAEVAKLMKQAGLVVIVALVSPYIADRRAAANIFDEGEFLEVFVDTPLSVAQERDPKGLYKKAAAGQIPNMTGVGQDYEAPERADVHLDGTQSVADNAERLVRAVLGE